MERTLTKLQKEALNLENFFPHFLREKAERFLFAISIFFLSFGVLLNVPMEARFHSLWPISQGLFLISFSLLLVTILIETYFQYLCERLEKENEVSFGTLLVLALEPNKKNIIKAFFHSRFGQEVGKRLGLAKESIDHFLKEKKLVAKTDAPGLIFHHFAGHLHDEHEELRDFLSSNHIEKQDFVSVSEVVDKMFNKRRKERAFFYPVLGTEEEPTLTFEAVTRKEIEDIEHLYRIIITEKAVQNIIFFFEEHALTYSSPSTRNLFITQLVSETIDTHADRFHGSSLILPSDVRTFIHAKKLELFRQN